MGARLRAGDYRRVADTLMLIPQHTSTSDSLSLIDFWSVSHDVNTSDMAWGEADLLCLPLVGFRFMCAMGVVVTPLAG